MRRALLPHKMPHKIPPQVPPSKNACKLVEFCSIPRSRQEMMDFVGLKDKKNFVKNYINPMIEQGMIEMTNPDKPTSKLQKYVTKKG